MHKFYQKKYYFISEYDTNLIDNLDKSVNKFIETIKIR